MLIYHVTAKIKYKKCCHIGTSGNFLLLFFTVHNMVIDFPCTEHKIAIKLNIIHFKPFKMYRNLQITNYEDFTVKKCKFTVHIPDSTRVNQHFRS